MTAPPPSKARQRFALLIIVLALLGAGGYQLDRKTRPILISGPMVHFPTPATMVITWTAKAFFKTGRATVIGPKGERLERSIQPHSDRYEARFENLTPGEAYSYKIFNNRFWGFRLQLTGPCIVSTPSPRGRTFRFIAFGDSGNGSNSQAALAGLVSRHDPDVVIHVGDLVYPAGAAKDYRRHFFEPNAELIRSVPFMASLGNHDVATDHGQPLLDVFVLPENGPRGIQPERNYYFDWGDARFVALDTNRVADGGVLTPQQMKTVVAPWLRAVLTDCDARWKFVFFHHPFYTGSTHSPVGTVYVKEAYAQVFEDCGVDMVFCGHNHLYERIGPIRNNETVPADRGVVYITTGAGGNSRYPEQDSPPSYIRAYNDAVFSFTQVDLTPSRLQLKQIGQRNDVIDTYTLTKPAQR